MSQIVKNPTPRQRFQEDPKIISSHRDVVGDPKFAYALDMALLEYQRVQSMAPQENYNACAAAHFKLVGAMEFMQLLRNLGESPTLPAAKPTANLDHKA